MNETPKTSMTLQNLSSGLTMNLTAASGIIRKDTVISALSGYDISKGKDSHGLIFDIVSITGNTQEQDPPSIAIGLYYEQDETVSELDLDINFTDIPDGTETAVECSKPEFNISRQPISGSSLIGSHGDNLEAFEMTVVVKLWIAAPDQLRKTSSLELTMSKIDGTSGGPVKKNVLQKIAINLCAQ